LGLSLLLSPLSSLLPLHDGPRRVTTATIKTGEIPQMLLSSEEAGPPVLTQPTHEYKPVARTTFGVRRLEYRGKLVMAAAKQQQLLLDDDQK
jgi:hypothetical protein